VTDGKYVALDELKLYILGSIADPNNPTVYNDAVQGTPDDSVLSQCIQRAEMEIDRIVGSKFDEDTFVLVNAFQVFVDGQQFLHLFAREAVPVTDISAIKYRDLLGDRNWRDLSFTSGDLVLPPEDYSRPDSAHAMVYVGNSGLSSRGTGQIQAKWSYTGGFSEIPEWLKGITCRLATFVYRIREAPMYKIVDTKLGIMQVPLRIPPDIFADLVLLQPVYS